MPTASNSAHTVISLTARRKISTANALMTGPKWLSDKEIGRRVREIRLSLKLTQLQFARLIERPGSQSEISALERADRKRPQDANLLGSIAAAGGLTLEHFQEGAEDTERAEKLVAAKWMRRLADQLAAEARATRPLRVAEEVADYGVDSVEDADEDDASGEQAS